MELATLGIHRVIVSKTDEIARSQCTGSPRTDAQVRPRTYECKPYASPDLCLRVAYIVCVGPSHRVCPGDIVAAVKPGKCDIARGLIHGDIGHELAVRR